MYVDIVEMVGDEGTLKPVGRISLLEDRLVADPPDDPALQDILRHPISLPTVGHFDAVTTPREFLENLHLQYRSPYFHATEMQS